VADEQMNAVAASAPPEYMPMIARVVSLLDKPGEDVSEVEIFTLRHADPGEVVDEISALFAPGAGTGNAEQTTRTAGFRFGGPGGLISAAPAPGESNRLKRQSTVTAVADRRTQSVVVAAAGNAMTQIRKMIARLDKGNAGVMKVTIIPIGSADAGTVLDALTVCFSGSSSSAHTQTSINTAFDARLQGMVNSQSTSSATSGVAGGSGSTSGLH
jgi:type II secretory pathway component GspD/PulD (secretin)